MKAYELNQDTEEGQEESLAAMLAKSAVNQQNLHKLLKIKHLRTSALPRAHAFSSNQTLSNEGNQSMREKETQHHGRNIATILTSSNRGDGVINADLTAVNNAGTLTMKSSEGAGSGFYHTRTMLAGNRRFTS